MFLAFLGHFPFSKDFRGFREEKTLDGGNSALVIGF